MILLVTHLKPFDIFDKLSQIPKEVFLTSYWLWDLSKDPLNISKRDIKLIKFTSLFGLLNYMENIVKWVTVNLLKLYSMDKHY